MKLLTTIVVALGWGSGWSQTAAPNWAGSLAYDLRTHQFAALTSTTLKSSSNLLGIRGLDGLMVAFGGTTLQEGRSSSAAIGGTGLELVYALPTFSLAPHTHVLADVGLGQGFRAGSAGSDWVVWAGASVRF